MFKFQNEGNIFLVFTVLVELILLAGTVYGGPMPETKSDLQDKKNYKNYRVLRTQPVEDVDVIKKLMMLDEEEDISFWKYPLLNQKTDIMASPGKLATVKDTLKGFSLRHETVVEDVEKLFQSQQKVSNFNEKAGLSSTMSWDRYHRYSVIINYAKQQQASRSDDLVTYKSIGTSTEGREIGLVTISSGGGGNKPAIFMDGGMHAREWISPATVTYIMHNLIHNKDYKNLVEQFDWYVVPIVNVDGYEYTFTNDRLWRKTRRPNRWSLCVGTDPNRNWGYHWGENDGSSKSPCSDVYRGPMAFSEPETLAVANAIMDRRDQIKLYLSLHSYSQLWLVPWEYTKQKSEDYPELLAMANIGATAIEKTYGTKYKVGTSPDLLYVASGGSDDWAKGHAGIKYSYSLELRDNGTYGFALPANQIIPTGEETLSGVAALARALYEKVTSPTD